MFPPLAILLGNYFTVSLKNVKSKNRALNFGFIITVVVYTIIGVGAIIAPKFIDFTRQSITPTFLYTEGILLIVSGVIIYIFYRANIIRGLFAIILSSAGFLYLANPEITIINNKSIKPLALFLQHQLQPQDEVVSFATYFQDLPFYIQRIVTVVDVEGELQYGILHQQNSRQWMIKDKEFFKRWYSDRKMYMLVVSDIYNSFSDNAKEHMYIIAQYLDTYLVTNKKPM